MNKRSFLYSLPIILLLIVAVAGRFATDFLGNKARQEIISESQASVLTLSIYVSSTLTNLEGAVKSLAGSPWISPALLSKQDRDITQANSALDRYNSALNASVSYLMGVDGRTVASSNRNDQDSFVGKSYRFRPYFQEAFNGHSYRYFAKGMTSLKRGFYASCPVQNLPGKVIGVVAMKKDLDEMETFFSKYTFCFLVSPDGIIFLSSKPAMVLKSLWPLDKATQEKLIASQQFGNKLLATVFFKKVTANGTAVTLEGKDYFVSRKVIDNNGWSIVLLSPTDRVWIYRSIGILATIFVCFLIMVFAGIIYLVDRSQKAIRQSEESKHLLLQAAGEGIFGVDATGRVTFINPAALRMLGFSSEEMLGQSAHALIHHSHKDGSNYPVEDCSMCASCTATTENRVTEEVLWHKEGSSFPADYSSMPIIKDGKRMGAVVIFRNITKRKRVEEALHRSETKFHTLYDSSSDAVMLLDEKGFFDCNKATLALFGCATLEVFCTKHPADLSPPQQPCGTHSMVLANQMIETAIEKGSIRFEWMHKRNDTDETFPAEVVLTAMELDGKPIVQAVVRDITDRKRAGEKIQYLATHDILTGLPNRMMFSQLLNHAIRTAQRYQRQFAVLFIDLDRFKIINDTLGHEAGDQLLQEVATRLKQSLRAVDVVGRLGGDEFVILIEEVSDSNQAATVAHKILTSVIKPITLMGQESRITASIGICMYPKDAEDEQTLMKNADIAMYLAKEEGKNNYQFYSEDIQSKSLERLSIETNLRFALERNELSLYYQAKVDFKTNAITGVEALLRWQNPYLGSVTPTQFIPVAEETGLIIPIGKWVLKTACTQNVAWQRDGLPPVCMAVNVSLRQLTDDHLIDDIRTALNDSGMAPNLLELEITESMVMHNPTRMIAVLAKIKNLGVRLAIDDFGTGYSSLAQIKHFPIDTLKIDRSFIRNIPQDIEDKAITEAIIAMGKTLSLTVVAEGVETVDQLNFLKEHSCDEMQGFYFSKPIVPEQFADLLRKHIPAPQVVS